MQWSSPNVGYSDGGFSAVGGALTVNIGGAATPSTLTQNSGGFLPGNSFLDLQSSVSTNVLTFSNPINNNGTVLTVYQSAAASSSTTAANLTGAITGNGGLSKNGTGLLNLSGANTYSGATTISAGTLGANSTGGSNSSTGTSTVTIATTGTLAGGTKANPGQISGAVIVNGKITAGSGATTTDTTIGTLSTGNETWNTGGTYAVKIGATNGSSDELIMTGLTNATSSPFNIQVVGLSTSTFYGGYKYIIADDTGAGLNNTNAFNISTFVLTTTGTSPAASNFSLTETGDGGTGEELVLTDTAAPEPTSFLLLLPCVGGLLSRRRSRIAGSANGSAAAI